MSFGGCSSGNTIGSKRDRVLIDPHWERPSTRASGVVGNSLACTLGLVFLDMDYREGLVPFVSNEVFKDLEPGRLPR